MSHTHEASVYLRCHECHTWGIPTPDDQKRCGNCGGDSVTLYRPPCCFEAENAALKAEVESWKVEAEHQERMAGSWAEPYKALKARLERAEAVCEAGADLNLEHYEWCDRRVGLAARREVPQPECDCGVLAFKVKLAKWREGKT